ncbi:hypothetical protein FH972_022724 [Carpinus fangiana]|uniref:Ras-GAP domain-containing protein n=1 Tax=Carpinus fangiana TaxID=176857 RepID=A0A5N6KTM1_9ROSI|nr:hypothetical protein FH972_022724 [Carpinus fangiana]
MSYDFHSRRPGRLHTTKTPSPLRHASNISNSSSENSYAPSISSTLTSGGSYSENLLPASAQKRGIGDTSPTKASSRDYHYELDRENPPPPPRQSLRTLAQAPAMVKPLEERSTSHVHARAKSFENGSLSENGMSKHLEPPTTNPWRQQQQKKGHSVGISRSDSRRAPAREHASPQTNILEQSELEKLGKSSTSHLRTLSRFAQDDDSFNAPQEQVVGLQGRRRLQRTDSARGKTPGYGGRTWIDSQRQFLQAYEYLCHIGEAKEWIEDVINKQLPPIVQLEEALRDGVTLAEIVQALYPERQFKIFHHQKLQYRHSDNIAIFFRFLAEVELPDLFRFELVDLYEKKNIPKVIYCIHALSWLLLRKGIVDFRIGNLVGQLEFEHTELEAMQKGLDKAGVSMPNFGGLRDEPEPEPVETEEERQDRELLEHAASIEDFQCQLRGALARLRCQDVMQHLWENEELIVDLQARIRGDFGRQVVGYRLEMRQFAVGLQSQMRGFLLRSGQVKKDMFWKSRETDVILLQSLARARISRQQTQLFRSKCLKHQEGLRSFQAALRGALCRWNLSDRMQETRQVEPSIVEIQAAIRGVLQRKRVDVDLAVLHRHTHPLVRLQAVLRATAWRKKVRQSQDRLETHETAITKLQGHIRGQKTRCQHHQLLEELGTCHRSTSFLQSALRGYNTRGLIEQDISQLETYTKVITNVQSAIRGYHQRQVIYEQLCDFNHNESSIIALQSLLRGMYVRNDTSVLLDRINAEEDLVVELQAVIRGNLVRSRFAEKKRFYEENMKKVIKIQSFIRGRQQGEAYKSLTTGKNPPVGTVKNFVHLLNDSDFDFDEEVESEKLRKAVGQRVRENEQTQQFIDELDAKIGLLAHNKIARDEFAKMQKHTGGSSLAIARTMSSRESFNLKALNKTSRAKLELYQELFFLLQTQPRFFARLFRRTREQGATDIEYKRLEMLVSSTFGYTQRRREEFFLLRLMSEAVFEEVDGCKSIAEFARGSFFFTRQFTSYTRAPRDRKYIREIVGSLVKTQIIDNMHLDLETDPLTIYRMAINNEELSTGRRSARDKDVPREQAIRDPQTRDAFIRHLQDLRDIVDCFLLSLEEALPRMPYGTRYVAQQMFVILCEKFPREDQQAILHVVGSWVWKTYIRPTFADPEHFGIVDRQLDAQQRRNLNEFLKVMGQVASGRVFGQENVYLQPLNSYMGEAIARVEDVWQQMLEIKDLETQMDYDEFHDLHAKVKPTLHIKGADVFAIHDVVAKEVSFICAGPEDAVLREVIRELGSAKSNEAEMSAAGSAEVTLSLSSKGHTFEDPDADIKSLFMETKRCVLYIIRVQAGANLLDIMVKPITQEDEARWEMLVRDELSTGSRKRGAYTDNSNNLTDISVMSYAELKSIALENILALQQRGRLSQANQYQDLLNEIAIDIRQKHKRRVQRQRELENVRATLDHLAEKARSLDETLRAYNDTFEQNLDVLQNKKGKSRLLMPFSKQWNHEKELKALGRTPQYGSFKYSAESLATKGILQEWRGRDLRRDDLTISSDKVNNFLIEGSSGSMMIPGASATFTWDDLIEAQYQSQKHIKFFSGEDGSGHNELTLDAKLFMQQVSKKFWPEGFSPALTSFQPLTLGPGDAGVAQLRVCPAQDSSHLPAPDTNTYVIAMKCLSETHHTPDYCSQHHPSLSRSLQYNICQCPEEAVPITYQICPTFPVRALSALCSDMTSQR